MTKSSLSILRLLCKCQINGEDFVNFCALLRKLELYQVEFPQMQCTLNWIPHWIPN